MTKRSPWCSRLEGVTSPCIYQSDGRSAGLWEDLKTIYSILWWITVAGTLLWLAYDWLVGG